MDSKNKMCGIVQDLLPLYVDDVCGEDSKAMVSDHISNCPDCAAMLRNMKNTECETSLREEGNEVVLKHAKKEKRKSFTVGMVFSGIFLIPVIVCMIVNLATGHGLSWFFIVLTSLMVAASLLIVPLMATNHKCLWTLGSFTASLMILLATICIYTRGRWFFVAALSVLFGLAVIFMPFVSRAIKTGFWSRNRALLVLGTDSLLYILMMLAIGRMNHSDSYGVIATAVSVNFLVFAWVILFIAKYLKAPKTVKAGLIVIWCGLFIAICENVVFMLLGYSVVWHAFHPLTWTFATLNSNVKWILFIVCAVIGGLLITCGLLTKEKKNENSI